MRAAYLVKRAGISNLFEKKECTRSSFPTIDHN